MNQGQQLNQMGGSNKPLQKYKLTLDNFFFWKIKIKKGEEIK
jgi:hypothetical protein